MHILPVYRIDQNMNNYCRLVWEFEKKEAPNSGIRDWFSSDFSDQTGTLHFLKYSCFVQKNLIQSNMVKSISSLCSLRQHIY